MVRLTFLLRLATQVTRRARRLGRIAVGGARDLRPEWWTSSSLALRWRLRSEGAALRPSLPGSLWRGWTNTCLLTHEDADRARREVARLGLPPHKDAPKNWDLLVAIGLILDRIPRAGTILDAGSTPYSKVLPWLYLYGYRSLHGIDLTYDRPIRRGPIRYRPMDLTRTTFANGSFDAITCLSVIEHGVSFDAYVREAARLLKPNGLLITSTDFWCEPVDTGGQEAYGVPIHILTPADIESCVGLAANHGLHLTGPLDLRCDDRVVHWARFGLEYTFTIFVLEKRLKP